MGLGRARRRKLERDLAKGNNIEKIKDVIKTKARNEIIDELEDTRVEILMNCFVIAMHDACGFGQNRCMRVLQAVDRLMVLADKGELTIEKVREMAEERTGLKVLYED